MPAAAAESCRANLVHLTPTHIWFGLKVWFQGLLPEHTIDCPGPIVTNIYIYIPQQQTCNPSVLCPAGRIFVQVTSVIMHDYTGGRHQCLDGGNADVSLA